MRIELTYTAWKAVVLPLNYTRISYKSGVSEGTRTLDPQSGVSEGTRTLDPLIKSQLLYRLSYRDILNGWGSKIRTYE